MKEIKIIFGTKRKGKEKAIMIYNTDYVKETQDNIIKDLRSKGHKESIYFES